MMPRGALLVLALSLVGCTVDATAHHPAAIPSLGAGERSDGTVRIVSDACSTVHLRPDDKLTVIVAGGRPLRGAAGQFCTDGTGLGLAKGDDHFCFEGDILPWQRIVRVEIEQDDAGRTVASLVLLPPVIAIAILSLRFDGLEALGGSSANAGKACAEGTLPEGAAVPVVTDPSDAAPLFERSTLRRARVRPSLRVDAGTCFIAGGCVLGAARAGATLLDVIDLSGGVRWEKSRASERLAGTLGPSLQGWFARAQWLATFAGVQFGFGSGLRVVPTAGVRLRPIGGLGVGLTPLGFTYFAAHDPRGPSRNGLLYTPSIDLGYEF